MENPVNTIHISFMLTYVIAVVSIWGAFFSLLITIKKIKWIEKAITSE